MLFLIAALCIILFCGLIYYNEHGRPGCKIFLQKWTIKKSNRASIIYSILSTALHWQCLPDSCLVFYSTKLQNAISGRLMAPVENKQKNKYLAVPAIMDPAPMHDVPDHIAFSIKIVLKYRTSSLSLFVFEASFFLLHFFFWLNCLFAIE